MINLAKIKLCKMLLSVMFFSSLGSLMGLRSVVDFNTPAVSSSSAQSSGYKVRHVGVVDKLQEAAQAINPFSSDNEAILDKDLTEPLKHAIISAVLRLSIDLLKNVARGNVGADFPSAESVQLLALKALLQGGVVGSLLGAAGKWGTWPIAGADSLLKHDIFAQFLLEFVEATTTEFLARGVIDDLTWMLTTTVAGPLVVAGLQSLFLRNERKHMYYESRLLDAAIRELRASSVSQ